MGAGWGTQKYLLKFIPYSVLKAIPNASWEDIELSSTRPLLLEGVVLITLTPKFALLAVHSRQLPLPNPSSPRPSGGSFTAPRALPSSLANTLRATTSTSGTCRTPEENSDDPNLTMERRRKRGRWLRTRREGVREGVRSRCCLLQRQSS